MWLDEEIQRLNTENSARYIEEHDVDPYESPELNDDYPEEIVFPDNFDIQTTFASRHPWSAEELPDIEKWRQASEPALNIAREGIQRSHYYYPMVSDRTPKMIHMNLGYTQEYSKVRDALAVNAMSLLYKDDVEACIAEIKVIYRFAMHVSQGQSLVEELVCHNLMNTGLECLASLCASEKCNSSQLKDLLQWVDEIEFVDDVGDRVDNFERYGCLDAVVAMAREGSSKNYPVGDLEAQIGSFSGIVDLEESLKQVNGYYDQVAEICRIKDPSEFESEWSSFDEEMAENEKWVMENAVKTALLGRKSKGVWLGRMISGRLLPYVEPVVRSENDIKARHEMLKVVIAAALYKKEMGAYPSSLDELAPKYIESIPIDSLTDEAYVWLPEENRILIHSKLWNDPKIGLSRNDRIVIDAKKVSWEEFSKEQQEDEEEEDEY